MKEHHRPERFRVINFTSPRQELTEKDRWIEDLVRELRRPETSRFYCECLCANVQEFLADQRRKLPHQSTEGAPA